VCVTEASSSFLRWCGNLYVIRYWKSNIIRLTVDIVQFPGLNAIHILLKAACGLLWARQIVLVTNSKPLHRLFLRNDCPSGKDWTEIERLNFKRVFFLSLFLSSRGIHLLIHLFLVVIINNNIFVVRWSYIFLRYKSCDKVKIKWRPAVDPLTCIVPCSIHLWYSWQNSTQTVSPFMIPTFDLFGLSLVVFWIHCYRSGVSLRIPIGSGPHGT
jgi:hypothetical protein